MEPLFKGPVAFVDLETTGGYVGRHRIIEIGLVATNGCALEYEWSTLVNPGMPIPPSVQHFTGITDEMVRCAPFFEDIAEELLERLEGRLFVAHNARFDYGFLRAEFARLGFKFTRRVACTVRLSRRLHPELDRHNLDALIEHHGLQVNQRHRALPDAQALYQFWCALEAERSVQELENVLRDITHLPSLPAHLPATLADELPEGPGVYRFYGEGDALLYVGKANNIRQRVLAHWQGATHDARAQQLAELTRRIDWLETAGELGALLTEAHLVRELKPLYNRQLRGSTQVFTWVIADDGAAPELAPVDQVPLSFENSDAFGLYRTEQAARKALIDVAREQRLCMKMLGLEESQGSCFAYQTGKCQGACVGREPLRLHTARLKMALAHERLRTWPFDGPVAIKEGYPGGREQIHVIDNWRHVVTVEEGDELPLRQSRQPFDVDVYRILSRYFSSTARPQIVPLPQSDLDAA
jgi:DNA polymerase-3 subunit epsilon